MPTITLTITDAPGDEVDILAVFDELQHAPSCAHQVVLEIMARTRANWSIDIRRGAKLEHHIAERLGMRIEFAPGPLSEIQRLRGEANVLRNLLSETTRVMETLIDDDETCGESACQMASLKDKCIAALTGAAA